MLGEDWHSWKGDEPIHLFSEVTGVQDVDESFDVAACLFGIAIEDPKISGSAAHPIERITEPHLEALSWRPLVLGLAVVLGATLRVLANRCGQVPGLHPEEPGSRQESRQWLGGCYADVRDGVGDGAAAR